MDCSFVRLFDCVFIVCLFVRKECSNGRTCFSSASFHSGVCICVIWHTWLRMTCTSGGGLFMDYGAHAMDCIDYLVGPIRSASGEALRSGLRHPVDDHVLVETVVAVTFRCAAASGTTPAGARTPPTPTPAAAPATGIVAVPPTALGTMGCVLYSLFFRFVSLCH
jgi:hypothetical protein